MNSYEDRQAKRMKNQVTAPGMQDLVALVNAGPLALKRTDELMVAKHEMDRAARDYLELVESRGYVSMQDRWVINQAATDNGFFDNAYKKVVRMITTQWLMPQAEDLHHPPSQANVATFGVTPQICVPGIHFPPGHYNFSGTLVEVPGIPITCGSPESTRFWFYEERDSIPGPPLEGWKDRYYDAGDRRLACILAPHALLIPSSDPNKNHRLKARGVTLLDANVRSMFDAPATGFLALGAQENMHVRFHFLQGNSKHRAKSVGFDLRAADHEGHWGGYNFEKSSSPDTEIHMADCNVEIFAEFVKTGIRFKGWGNRITFRHYYGKLGFHLFGGKTHQGEGNIVSGFSSKAGAKAPAEVIQGIDSSSQALFISTGEYWMGQDARRTGGGFFEGESVI